MTCCCCKNRRGALGAGSIADNGLVSAMCPLGEIAPLPGTPLVKIVELVDDLAVDTLDDLLDAGIQNAIVRRAGLRRNQPHLTAGLIGDTLSPIEWRGLCPFATYDVVRALERIDGIDARAIGMSPSGKLDHWFTVVNGTTIIDPTWKQFLANAGDMARFPHVLMGSIDEITHALGGADVGNLLDWYRSGIQLLEANPTYVAWP